MRERESLLETDRHLCRHGRRTRLVQEISSAAVNHTEGRTRQRDHKYVILNLNAEPEGRKHAFHSFLLGTESNTRNISDAIESLQTM